MVASVLFIYLLMYIMIVFDLLGTILVCFYALVNFFVLLKFI